MKAAPPSEPRPSFSSPRKVAGGKSNATLPDHLCLGITLTGLMQLRRALPEDAVAQTNANIPRKEDGTLKFPENKEINGYVNQYHITADTKKDQLTTCERLRQQGSPHVGRANVFVSWALSTSLDTLIDALRAFLDDHPELPEDRTFFWVCDYVIRQTNVRPDLDLLGECVASCGHTVLLLEPWESAEPLKRAYCVKEVFYTRKSGNKFSLAMSKTQQASFVKALCGDFGSIMASLSNVDVGKAECRNQEDKEAILKELKELEGGLAKCNQDVCELMREQMLLRGQAALQAMQKDDSEEAATLMNGLGRLYQSLVRYHQKKNLCWRY